MSGPSIVCSPNDKRMYRYLELENGLKVTVISEPKAADGVGEKRAAAAVAVGVGSFRDTKELQGMAHFVEHMLFMGSEKYPGENELDEFVSMNGGFDNACTDMEDTLFAFEVAPEKFEEGLAMFAGFFVSPLMRPDCLARELEAVDSEYQMHQQSDGVRHWQILASLANPDHPLSLFTWGNVKSLKTDPEAAGVPIRDRLLDFWRTHYSADRMTLCLLSDEPLDTLEELARKNFSAVPSDGKGKYSHAHLPAPWAPETFRGKVLYVTPVKDIHKVEIFWILPPQIHLYRHMSADYVAEALGHEGTGSLLELLKQRAWATGLTASASGGGQEVNTQFNLLTVTVHLSEAGLENVNHVIGLVMQICALHRREGPQEYLWQEWKAIEAATFRFKEEEPVFDYVETVAADMLDYPAADILTGGSQYFEYDPVGIQDILERLTPEAAIVTVMSQKVEEHCTETEPWFGGRWALEPMPGDWLDRWVAEAEAGATVPQLSLPEPNPFIAREFELFPPPAENVAHPAGVDPAQIWHSPRCTVWHLHDAEFKVPRAQCTFEVLTPTLATPKDVAIYHLWVSVLELAMKKATYMASVAGLRYCFLTFKTGMGLRVSGFDEKIPELLDLVLKHICELDVDSRSVEMARESKIRTWKNTQKQPSTVGRSFRLSIIDTTHIAELELVRLFEQVSIEDIQSFSYRMRNSGSFARCAIHGNIPTATALKLGHRWSAALVAGPALTPGVVADGKCATVPVGNHMFRQQNPNEDDENSYLECYIQIGNNDDADFMLLRLIADMMSEPLFNELRTKQQLAYSVHCGYRMTNGHLGFAVTLQPKSSKISVMEADKRVEGFLHWFCQYLEKLSSTAFADKIASRIADCSRADRNLSERCSRDHSRISDGTYDFRYLEREVAGLRSVTLEQVLAYYKEKLAPASAVRRKLLVAVYGRSEDAEGTISAAAPTGDDDNDEESGSDDESVEGDNDEDGEDGGDADDTEAPGPVLWDDWAPPTPIVDLEAFRDSLEFLPVTTDCCEGIFGGTDCEGA